MVRMPAAVPARKRGRPRKFPQPSQVVALTLPEDVVRGLRRVHPDLAWAIVTLFEKHPPSRVGAAADDVELVTIAGRQSLKSCRESQGVHASARRPRHSTRRRSGVPGTGAGPRPGQSGASR